MTLPKVSTKPVFKRPFVHKGIEHTLTVTQRGAFFLGDIDDIDIGKAKGKKIALTENGYDDEIACLMFTNACVILTDAENLAVTAALNPVSDVL